MSVATHLGIDLAEYDARIRTFIPDYELMLDAAASAVPAGAGTIVDLGVGTGALGARCLARARRAHLVGVDVDTGMLDVAARRLGKRATLVAGSFLRAPLPPCDAAVASFALHHVRTRRLKATLYSRLRKAIRRGGRLIVIDCQPARNAKLARAQMDAWRAHLRRSYTPQQANRFLRAWGKEDVYVPLDDELALMQAAGFRTEVLWRRGAFAVIVAIDRR